MVNVRNTISGQIADVSPKLLEHPVLGRYLELADVEIAPIIKQEKAARKPKFEAVEVEELEEAVVEEIEIPTLFEEDN